MTQLIEIKSVPKIAQDKGMLVWFGSPTTDREIDTRNHKVVYVDTYKRSCALPIQLVFTLPVNQEMDDELFAAIKHIAPQACKIVDQKRRKDGFLRKFHVGRELNTYAVLRQVSWDALHEARDYVTRSYYKLLTSMVFSAFCLEAFMNHIGRMYFPNWEAEEKKLNHNDKLKKVLKKLDLHPDFGVRPFQTYGFIFGFRNQIAHGRTETLSHEVEGWFLIDEDPPEPLPDWEKCISYQQAEIFFQDTMKIIEIIYREAGFRDFPFFVGSISSYEIRADITLHDNVD